jgi:hypothetical protein
MKEDVSLSGKGYSLLGRGCFFLFLYLKKDVSLPGS